MIIVGGEIQGLSGQTAISVRLFVSDEKMKVMKSNEGVVRNNTVTDVTGGGEGGGEGDREEEGGGVDHDHDEVDGYSQVHKDMGRNSIVGNSSNNSNNNNSNSSSSNSTHRSSDDILNDRAAVSGASRMKKTKSPHSIATESQDYSVPHIGSFRRHCNVCKQPYPALHSFYHQVRYIPCCADLYCLVLSCLVLSCLVLSCLALLSIPSSSSFLYHSSTNQRSIILSLLYIRVLFIPSKSYPLFSILHPLYTSCFILFILHPSSSSLFFILHSAVPSMWRFQSR